MEGNSVHGATVRMVEVAAGVLTDAQGRVLLMQRLPGKHLAGLWEFPGGKLEPGETVAQALARELREELGVEVAASTPLIAIPWRYPEKTVRLHAMRVAAWRGDPVAREGHPLRWVHVHDMDVAAMPAADAPVVAALRLPDVYVISDETASGFLSHFPARASADNSSGAASLSSSPPALPGGEGWGERGGRTSALYQLRLPDAARGIVRRVAAECVAGEPSLQDRLLISHDIELARELGLGVHLSAKQLRELRQRPLPAASWVGASCHDAHELELAARLGADFATLSPVRRTASHLQASPLGWERFAQLVADARLPVYALGGVGPDDLATARASGAQGVAGIRAFQPPM